MPASDMILEAVAATRAVWPDVPPLGLVTFIDPTKVHHKRDPGRCYLKAGFRRALCPNQEHIIPIKSCPSCYGMTVGGLLAFQLLPEDMPAPAAAIAPMSGQLELSL